MPGIDLDAPLVLSRDDSQILVLKRVLDAHIWQDK